MQRSRFFTMLGIAFLLGVGAPSYAAIDADAAVVKVRKHCQEAGVALNNCFTTMGALVNWMYQTRRPSATAPLLVEIGPGDFSEFISCPSTVPFSHVTFRGAGMMRTTIGRITLGPGCTELSFADLTVQEQPGSGYAVVLNHTGLNTHWTNVFLNGSWQEYAPAAAGCSPGQHYWFSSRTSGYYSVRCDRSWFFGSELNGQPFPAGGTQYELRTLIVAASGEVHVYGSNINAVTDTARTATVHVAVEVLSGGQVHLHGTGIDLISASASHVVALKASGGGEIHANETAYNMKTGSGGKITRIDNVGGHVHAPYVWEHHPTPPAVSSVTGADVAVDTAGSAPRLIIYHSDCTGSGGPWYDPVARACR